MLRGLIYLYIHKYVRELYTYVKGDETYVKGNESMRKGMNQCYSKLRRMKPL